MTVAVAFFALVGIIIVGGIGYGVGHVDGMREGYDQGRAAAVDREVELALRVERATRSVHICEPPPFDFEKVRTGGRRWHGG